MKIHIEGLKRSRGSVYEEWDDYDPEIMDSDKQPLKYFCNLSTMRQFIEEEVCLIVYIHVKLIC